MKDVSRRQLTQSFTGKNLDFTLSWKLDGLIWRMDYRERQKDCWLLQVAQVRDYATLCQEGKSGEERIIDIRCL